MVVKKCVTEKQYTRLERSRSHKSRNNERSVVLFTSSTPTPLSTFLFCIGERSTSILYNGTFLLPNVNRIPRQRHSSRKQRCVLLSLLRRLRCFVIYQSMIVGKSMMVSSLSSTEQPASFTPRSKKNDNAMFLLRPSPCSHCSLQFRHHHHRHLSQTQLLV